MNTLFPLEANFCMCCRENAKRGVITHASSLHVLHGIPIMSSDDLATCNLYQNNSTYLHLYMSYYSQILKCICNIYIEIGKKILHCIFINYTYWLKLHAGVLWSEKMVYIYIYIYIYICILKAAHEI